MSSDSEEIVKDERFPLTVEYCPKCGLPPEYCEFGPHPAKCLGTEDASAEKKEEAPAKGGKGKKAKGPAEVLISVQQRNKRKNVTTVTGADGFEIRLQDLAKALAKKCSCGASVVKNAAGVEVVDIQGDVRDTVANVLVSQFKVPGTSIFFVDKKTKTPFEQEGELSLDDL